MNLKPVQLQLDTDEVRRILQVALDDDTQGSAMLMAAMPGADADEGGCCPGGGCC